MKSPLSFLAQVSQAMTNWQTSLHHLWRKKSFSDALLLFTVAISSSSIVEIASEMNLKRAVEQFSTFATHGENIFVLSQFVILRNVSVCVWGQRINILHHEKATRVAFPKIEGAVAAAAAVEVVAT